MHEDGRIEAWGTLSFIAGQRVHLLSPQALDRDPARRPIEHQLLAALHTTDAPGALLLGEPVTTAATPLSNQDALADDVAAGALDWLPFTPEPIDLQSTARPVAQVFWQRVAAHTALSAGFRALAREMSARVAA